MSHFEAMAAHVLRCDPAVNNEALAQSERHDSSETNASFVVGGRTRKNLELRFYDQKELRTLSIEDNKTLRDWIASNPEEFGQSKKIVLNTLRDNKNKRQNQDNHKKNSDMNDHVQSVAIKLIDEKIKEIDNDNTTKKFRFTAREIDAKAGVEKNMNKIKSKHGFVGSVTVRSMMEEVHSVPQGIKSVIKSKSPKPQKK